MKKQSMKSVWIYGLVAVVLMLLATKMMDTAPQKELTTSQLYTLFSENKITEAALKDSTLKYVLSDGTKAEYKVTNLESFNQIILPVIKEKIVEGTLQYNATSSPGIPWWVNYLVTFVMVGGLGVIMFMVYKNVSGGGKGGAGAFIKAKVKMGEDQKKKITFDQVAGAEEEKEELQEIVDFLKNPKKFLDVGARIPKGVLLVGHPGTGKTLLARAVAGEAGVPFLSISGSDFLELYVGVGAGRVRDLFEQAKRVSPSIIFIDEIDAVGRQRGAGLGGGHDEREQTLNQLLVEMDGFAPNEGIIVMAATNRPDILDSALLRAGRFDRQIEVGLPDVIGREGILNVHAKGKLFAPDVNFKDIAKETVGFSGAEIENILNEAAILAVRRNKTAIENVDIQDAVMKVIVGVEKKSKKVSEKSRKLTAFHEGGHAICAHVLKTQDEVSEISIIPRGRAGGYTMHRPDEDKDYTSKMDMFENIVSLLGGRVAEQLMLEDISTGASSDIQRASAIARAMVTKYGMSEKIGPVIFENSHDEVFLGRDFSAQKSCSEAVMAEIDAEIKNIIDKAYAKAEQILKDYNEQLVAVANALLEREKLSGSEFVKVFNNEPLEPSDAPKVISAIENNTKESDSDSSVSDLTLKTEATPKTETNEDNNNQ